MASRLPLLIFAGNYSEGEEHVRRCGLERGEFIILCRLEDMSKIRGICGDKDSIPVAHVGTFGDRVEHLQMVDEAKSRGFRAIRHYNPKAT